MQIRCKKLTGFTVPSTCMDKVFLQNGFHKAGNYLMPVYKLYIYDASINTGYVLKIPTTLINKKNNKQEFYRIEEPELINKNNKNLIPANVKKKVEEKLKEILAELHYTLVQRT